MIEGHWLPGGAWVWLLARWISGMAARSLRPGLHSIW
jgi:hypothetical protein